MDNGDGSTVICFMPLNVRLKPGHSRLPSLLSGLTTFHCHCSGSAVAQVQSLAWELWHSTGTGKKKKNGWDDKVCCIHNLKIISLLTDLKNPLRPEFPPTRQPHLIGLSTAWAWGIFKTSQEILTYSLSWRSTDVDGKNHWFTLYSRNWHNTVNQL